MVAGSTATVGFGSGTLVAAAVVVMAAVFAVAFVARGRRWLAVGFFVAAVVAQSVVAAFAGAAGAVLIPALGAEVFARRQGALAVGAEGGAAMLRGEAARVGAAEVGARWRQRMATVRAELRCGEGRTESSGRRAEAAVAPAPVGTAWLAALVVRRRAAGLRAAARVFGAGLVAAITL